MTGSGFKLYGLPLEQSASKPQQPKTKRQRTDVTDKNKPRAAFKLPQELDEGVVALLSAALERRSQLICELQSQETDCYRHITYQLYVISSIFA